MARRVEQFAAASPAQQQSVAERFQTEIENASVHSVNNEHHPASLWGFCDFGVTTQDRDLLTYSLLPLSPIFTGRMPFLPPNQQCQSTEGTVGDGGGGHWLVRMEWRLAGWSVYLPLLIFRSTIKFKSSLLAPAHPGGPGEKAVKRLW